MTPVVGPWVGVGDDEHVQDGVAVSGGGGGFTREGEGGGPSGNGGSTPPPDPDTSIRLVYDSDTTLTWNGDTLDWSE